MRYTVFLGDTESAGEKVPQLLRVKHWYSKSLVKTAEPSEYVLWTYTSEFIWQYRKLETIIRIKNKKCHRKISGPKPNFASSLFYKLFSLLTQEALY